MTVRQLDGSYRELTPREAAIIQKAYDEVSEEELDAEMEELMRDPSKRIPIEVVLENLRQFVRDSAPPDDGRP